MKKEENIKFMKEAIKEAYTGITAKEGGPFGCIIVKDGKIIGRGHNQVIKNNDPTCHGEMQAIRDACKNLGTFDLRGSILFTTSRACPMCNGAIAWSRISEVYEACNYDDAADIGFDDKEFFENPIEGKTLCREEGLELFKEYKASEHKMY